jgi:orotate phosphoribosyltransferase
VAQWPDKILTEAGPVTVFDPGFPSTGTSKPDPQKIFAENFLPPPKAEEFLSENSSAPSRKSFKERFSGLPTGAAHDPRRLPTERGNRPPHRPRALGNQGGSLQRGNPFTLASGLPSPTYIDCRKLISYPRIRSTLMDFLTITVMRDAGFEAFDNIAGGETAGIPFAALVAERMALPMTYVRKKPKGYGRNARIEGAMTEGQRVLLVEDLTTDGGSKLSFVDAIRDTGATCAHTAVIFYYGIFPETSSAWPITASRCTICAPGGTCWPRRAQAAPLTPPPWPRSRFS